MSIECILLLSAFVGTLLSAVWRVPLWVPVLLMCMAMLLNCLSAT